MHPAGLFGEDEILHLGVGLLVAGLAEQHHHDDPLDLLDVDLLGIEREQPVDDELTLSRRQSVGG